jgi:hypothetical protein
MRLPYWLATIAGYSFLSMDQCYNPCFSGVLNALVVDKSPPSGDMQHFSGLNSLYVFIRHADVTIEAAASSPLLVGFIAMK